MASQESELKVTARDFLSKKRDLTPPVMLTICVFLTAAYFVKPDFLAALTIWPFWVFAGLSVLPLLFRLRKDRLKWRLATVSTWMIAWFAVGDEPISLGRTIFHGSTTGVLRVVSLNCAGGSIEVAREVIAQKPDVVLLQESPNRGDLEKIRSELGSDWSVLGGVDGSILVRGRLMPVALPRMTNNFSAAWAELSASKEPVLIVSLRLKPPIFRLDYWNPECWQAYAKSKVDRRSELVEIANFVHSELSGAPLILGGDFNTPPDWTITNSLDSICEDAFRVSGQGWGATGVNDYPMVRIDQVWASSHFKPMKVVAKKTKFSDHRMVVAEFAR